MSLGPSCSSPCTTWAAEINRLRARIKELESAQSASMPTEPSVAMVERFLTWPLPDSVCCDPIAMKQGEPHRTGTNLLTFSEAKQMLAHVLEPSFKHRHCPNEDGGCYHADEPNCPAMNTAGELLGAAYAESLKNAAPQTVPVEERRTGEIHAYRKALEEIIEVGVEADAVAIAHAAITPYTPWVAASAEEEAALGIALSGRK